MARQSWMLPGQIEGEQSAQRRPTGRSVLVVGQHPVTADRIGRNFVAIEDRSPAGLAGHRGRLWNAGGDARPARILFSLRIVDRIRRQVLANPVHPTMADRHNEACWNTASRDQRIRCSISLPGAGEAVACKGFKTILAIMHMENGVSFPLMLGTAPRSEYIDGLLWETALKSRIFTNPRGRRLSRRSIIEELPILKPNALKRRQEMIVAVSSSERASVALNDPEAAFFTRNERRKVRQPRNLPRAATAARLMHPEPLENFCLAGS